MSALEKVLHGPLLNCADGIVSPGQLDPSTVILGLYFSASWCGPCKAFTPLLAQMYKNVERRLPGALEIVFVSKDKTFAQYDSYASTMPWKAIPFEDVEASLDISLEFGSRSIPHLVFIDLVTEQVSSANAVSMVRQDPSGQFLFQDLTRH